MTHALLLELSRVFAFDAIEARDGTDGEQRGAIVYSPVPPDYDKAAHLSAIAKELRQRARRRTQKRNGS
jgi:hypothetical protein